MPCRASLISVTGLLLCCIQMIGIGENKNTAKAQVASECLTECMQRAAAPSVDPWGVLPVGSVIVSVFPWDVLQARYPDAGNYWRPADGQAAPGKSAFAAICKKMAFERASPELLQAWASSFVAYLPNLTDAFLPRLQAGNDHVPKVQLCDEENRLSSPLLLEPDWGGAERPQRDAKHAEVAGRAPGIYFYVKIN